MKPAQKVMLRVTSYVLRARVMGCGPSPRHPGQVPRSGMRAGIQYYELRVAGLGIDLSRPVLEPTQSVNTPVLGLTISYLIYPKVYHTLYRLEVSVEKISCNNFS